MAIELNMKTIKPVLKKLVLGQIIALCIAVTGIVNEQITSKTRNNVNAPALTTVSVYLLQKLLIYCKCVLESFVIFFQFLQYEFNFFIN